MTTPEPSSERAAYKFSDADQVEVMRLQQLGHPGFELTDAGLIVIPKSFGHPVRLLLLMSREFFTHLTPASLRNKMKAIYRAFVSDLRDCQRYLMGRDLFGEVPEGQLLCIRDMSRALTNDRQRQVLDLLVQTYAKAWPIPGYAEFTPVTFFTEKVSNIHAWMGIQAFLTPTRPQPVLQVKKEINQGAKTPVPVPTPAKTTASPNPGAANAQLSDVNPRARKRQRLPPVMPAPTAVANFWEAWEFQLPTDHDGTDLQPALVLWQDPYKKGEHQFPQPQEEEVRGRNDRLLYTFVPDPKGFFLPGPQMNVHVEILLMDGYLREVTVPIRQDFHCLETVLQKCCYELNIVPDPGPIVWYGIEALSKRWFLPLDRLTVVSANFSRLRIHGARKGKSLVPDSRLKSWSREWLPQYQVPRRQIFNFLGGGTPSQLPTLSRLFDTPQRFMEVLNFMQALQSTYSPTVTALADAILASGDVAIQMRYTDTIMKLFAEWGYTLQTAWEHMRLVQPENPGQQERVAPPRHSPRPVVPQPTEIQPVFRRLTRVTDWLDVQALRQLSGWKFQNRAYTPGLDTPLSVMATARLPAQSTGDPWFASPATHTSLNGYGNLFPLMTLTSWGKGLQFCFWNLQYTPWAPTVAQVLNAFSHLEHPHIWAQCEWFMSILLSGIGIGWHPNQVNRLLCEVANSTLHASDAVKKVFHAVHHPTRGREEDCGITLVRWVTVTPNSRMDRSHARQTFMRTLEPTEQPLVIVDVTVIYNLVAGQWFLYWMHRDPAGCLLVPAGYPISELLERTHIETIQPSKDPEILQYCRDRESRQYYIQDDDLQQLCAAITAMVVEKNFLILPAFPPRPE